MSISSLHLNHYRSQLGMSLSEESPFEGTIKENLTFGNIKISDENIYSILDKVGLSQFIKEQPMGLQTIINAEGNQLSYTIAKKFILARAILKEPKILILEDPLDRFDQVEMKNIINYLTDKSQPWALIVVSTSKNWKEKCDELLLLEKGKATFQKI